MTSEEQAAAALARRIANASREQTGSNLQRKVEPWLAAALQAAHQAGERAGLARALARKLGVSQAATMEMALRLLAKREGVE